MPASTPAHGGGPEPAPPVPDEGDNNDNNDFSPLLDLLRRFPDLIEQYVLKRLDPIARAWLARTGGAFHAVVYPMSIFPFGHLLATTTRGAVRVFKLVDFLGFAKANGCPCYYAARGGHLETLQWAREQGCQWDAWTCYDADFGGHLEVLQWARQHGCPWTAGTSYATAAGGHLAMLQWAREHGFPWNEDNVVTTLLWAGHLAALRWALSHGCPFDTLTCRLPLRADTWTCCSWRGRTAARGARRGVPMLPEAGTWRCCSWRGRTAARGISGPVNQASRHHPESLAWVRQQPA